MVVVGRIPTDPKDRHPQEETVQQLKDGLKEEH
jgi:hypothetical protein